MFVCAQCTCMFECMWKPEDNLGYCLPFFLRPLGYVLYSGPCLSRLPLPPQCTDCKCTLLPGFIQCVLGMKLRSSCLQDKCFSPQLPPHPPPPPTFFFETRFHHSWASAGPESSPCRSGHPHMCGHSSCKCWDDNMCHRSLVYSYLSTERGILASLSLSFSSSLSSTMH